ncbi:MAG TPA: toll/interleukin-1 receptor domain-containing protein [Burkholderiales bacterium]|nr:toll/interleukin-1 receptor domain-containing protein [Burkholderiales bacterium]
MARIFISYRRIDSAAYAGRLFDRLRNHFGDDEVFMDLEGIDPGADFSKVVAEKARAADVLIALIGRDWLTPSKTGTLRRLDDPNDLVVREIATALEAQRLVIPVLAGNTAMPARADLPESIAALAERNAIELSDQRFHADVDRLIKVIERSAPAAAKRRIMRWIVVPAALVLIAGAWMLMPRNSPPLVDTQPAQKSTPVTVEKPPPAGKTDAAPKGDMATPAPTWDQMRAIPVVYAETFDPSTVLDIWKPAPVRAPWTEQLTGGRYCVSNTTQDSAAHYIHVSLDDYDLREAPVNVKVMATGSGSAPFAGGGLMYRFDEATRTYYALLLSSAGQLSLWRRDKGGASKLYGGEAPRVKPGTAVTLAIMARGNRLYLFADETLVASVADTGLRGDKTGVVVMSTGRYCFDDFVVRSASLAR